MTAPRAVEKYQILDKDSERKQWPNKDQSDGICSSAGDSMRKPITQQILGEQREGRFLKRIRGQMSLGQYQNGGHDAHDRQTCS